MGWTHRDFEAQLHINEQISKNNIEIIKSQNKIKELERQIAERESKNYSRYKGE